MDHVTETPDVLVDGSADHIPGADASPPTDDIDALLKALRNRQFEHGIMSRFVADANARSRKYRDRVTSAFRETTLILARTVRQLPKVELEDLLARARKAEWLPAKPAGDIYTVLARLGCGPLESKSNVARMASVIRAIAERGLVADEVFVAGKTFWAVHRELCAPAGRDLTIRLDAGQAAALDAGAAVTIRLVRDPDSRTGRFTVAGLIVDQDDAMRDRQAEVSRAASAGSPAAAPDAPQGAHQVIGAGAEERVPPDPIATRSDAELSEVTECSAVVAVDVDREDELADTPAGRCAFRFERNVMKADRAAFKLLERHGAFQTGGIWVGSPFEGLNDIVNRFGGTFVDQIEAPSKPDAMDAAAAGHSRLVDRVSRNGALQSARGGAAGSPRRSLISSGWLDAQWGRPEVLSGPSSPRAVRS